jgi:fructose-bisphosphate aldolase class II
MTTLREILADADVRHVAIGHFNISDLAGLKAVTEAARSLDLPVLIGLSEGERGFVGLHEAVALVRTLRETYGHPVFLNADHTHSLDKVKEAAEAGFDEILFDGSALPFEENIMQTREAVRIVREIDSSIVVEGEIGFIGSNSEVMDASPEKSFALSTPEEAVRFVKETGVDVLAPSVGNMHGLSQEMVKGIEHKKLNIGRIEEIKKAVGIFMTLHGGSGTADDGFADAIAAGMNIVHVSTELRVAWRKGIESALAAQPDEVAPYKLFGPALASMESIVADRLRLFNSPENFLIP